MSPRRNEAARALGRWPDSAAFEKALQAIFSARDGNEAARVFSAHLSRWVSCAAVVVAPRTPEHPVWHLHVRKPVTVRYLRELLAHARRQLRKAGWPAACAEPATVLRSGRPPQAQGKDRPERVALLPLPFGGRAEAAACCADPRRAWPAGARAIGARAGLLWGGLVRLFRRAVTDDLTGLYNRRGLAERLTALCASAEQHGQPLAVLIADLDRLKRINDTLGHAMGDEILRAFARAAQRAVRGRGVVARYGGDEIVALLPGATLGRARTLAEQWLQRLRARRFRAGGQLLRVTASVGVACGPPGGARASNLDNLLARADRALARAKRAGRDRVATG